MVTASVQHIMVVVSAVEHLITEDALAVVHTTTAVASVVEPIITAEPFITAVASAEALLTTVEPFVTTAVLSITEVVTMVETRTSAEALVLEAVLILAALVPSVDHVTVAASVEAPTAVVASVEDLDHMVVDTSEVAATEVVVMEVVVMEAMAAVEDTSVDVANPTATDAPRHSSFAVSGSSVCDDRQPESLYS